MKIKITNKTLEFIASLKRKTEKQKEKMVRSIIGRNKNIDKIFNVSDDYDGLSRSDKILHNIIDGIARQYDLMPGIEVKFTAKPKVKKLSLFKRIVRLFRKDAYEKEYRWLERHNKSYKSLVIAAKSAFSNVPEESEEDPIEVLNDKTETNKVIQNANENLNDSRVSVDLEDRTFIEEDDVIIDNHQAHENESKENELELQ